MLYPAAVEAEEEIYYDPLPQFTYCEEVESNFAPKISTRSSGSGNLVMYRDSFGNALLPYMAEAYEHAYFSRALPYQLPDLSAQEADTLIIERAERFLPDMAQEAPYMEAPVVDTAGDCAAEKGAALKIADLAVTRQGEYTNVTGKVPADKMEYDARIYIRVNGDICYEAFPVSCADGQEGFSMLLPADALQEKGNEFELLIQDDHRSER